jgi:hypothetical protein
MIISQSRRFVFVHVPKSAGTSITRLLAKLTTYRDLEVGGTPMGEAMQRFCKKRFGLSKHASAAEIRAVMGEADWQAFFRFAIVRNPYTRAFSSFNYLHRQLPLGALSGLAPMKQLRQFGDFVRSDYFRSDATDRILEPQTLWTGSAPAAMLSFIGSVEDIEADTARVLRQIAADGTGSAQGRPEASAKVAVHNRSTERPDALWALLRADPGAEQCIFERYACDFAAFGYRRFAADPEAPYDERRQDGADPAP